MTDLETTDDQRKDPRAATGPARGTLAGWMAPATAEPWYAIDVIEPARHCGVRLVLAGDGWELVGRLWQDQAASRRWAWQEWSAGLKSWQMLTPYRVLRPGQTRHRREPTAFRPVDPLNWPGVRGGAGSMLGPVVRASPPPTASPPEDVHPECDGWPYPNVRLGLCVPPLSIPECEARVLRALRQMDSLPRVGNAPPKWAADIPREMLYLMVRYQEVERQQTRDSYVPDAKVAWFPTRRDAGDWDYALGWWLQLAGHERQLFKMRAANPVYSWRSIAERESYGHPQTAQNHYRKALEKMFEIARGGEQ